MDSNDDDNLSSMFFHHATTRQKELQDNNGRFVYYTTAETAIKIIKNAELWMRNSSMMNDYSEIRYGQTCLAHALHNGGRQLLDNIFERHFSGLIGETLDELDNQMQMHVNQTYISCFSEHRDDEDNLGRLSMWRAYGGATGVALVFNNKALFNNSNELRIYTSPVVYFTKELVLNELKELCGRLTDGLSIIQKQSRETIKGYLWNALRFAILSIKHPGFKEEIEWRAIYQPGIENSNHVRAEIETIRGVPQLVQKVPLIDVPQSGLTGIEAVTGIDRVIIGPTAFPAALFDALGEALRSRGINNPSAIIKVSNIPLRH